jgi:hypothetical protein
MSSENSKNEDTAAKSVLEKSPEELDEVMPLEDSKADNLEKPMRSRGALVLNGETQKVISKYLLTSNLMFV